MIFSRTAHSSIMFVIGECVKQVGKLAYVRMYVCFFIWIIILVIFIYFAAMI